MIKARKIYITNVRPKSGAIEEYECWEENLDGGEFTRLGWKSAKAVTNWLLSGRGVYTARKVLSKIKKGKKLVLIIRTKEGDDVRTNLSYLQDNKQ